MASIRSPSNWKKVWRKHREVLNIFLDPPQTGRILLKSKKFVNACLWSLDNFYLAPRGLPNSPWMKMQKESNEFRKNALARRKTCDRLAHVWGPTFSARENLNEG